MNVVKCSKCWSTVETYTLEGTLWVEPCQVCQREYIKIAKEALKLVDRYTELINDKN